MNKVKCHICDHENEMTNGQPALCEVCGSDLSNRKAETKLMEAWRTASYATADQLSAMRVEACAYLTDKRLIIIPLHYSGIGLHGMLTASLTNKTQQKYGPVSLPLEQIKSVRDGKFGIFLKAILIDIIDGGLIKLSAPKLKDWKAAIMNAVPKLQ